MKLTKKLEAEVLKAYHTIWDAYLKGDMRTFASILDENCYIIGSAAAEVFTNKKSAVKYYKATSEQITGKAEMRNRKISVMPADNGFIVNEELDFYLLIDNQWTFYGPARISSLFHKKNNKWKVIHQHGSFPDSKTEGGEQVNTEKIKAENIQLRDAVKRRTIELENKNRELEIETSLERVRAQVMTMHRSEELIEVCKTLLTELQTLGFQNIRNTQIAIANDDKGSYMSYDYYTNGKFYVGELYYDSHPLIKSLAIKMRQNKAEFINVSVRGTELDEWRKYLKSLIQRPAPKLDAATSLNYYYYSIGPGGLGFCAYAPLNDEEMSLLKRFKKVFDLAYRRYADVAKAEAQAREAEIELALERVRAKTMAMQKPSEFVELINVIGQQFVHLGFDIEWVNFGANGLEVAKGIDIWNFAVIPGADPMSARVFIPYFDHPVFIKAGEEIDEYRRTGNDFFIIAFGKDDKDRWLDHFFTKTVFKDVPDEYKVIQYAKPGYTTSNLALKDTWLSIGKFDNRSFTDEQHAIFRKFAKAFGQAYTRFLDLQKAEAQAREAQIEVSLERVRSRAMAMQTSEELNELIGTVFTELTKLDLVLTRCVILIYEGNEKGVRWWMANSEAPSMPMNFFVKYADLPFFNEYLRGWHERSLKWQYILEGEDKIRTDKVLFNETELSLLPDFVIAGMKANNKVYLSASFNNYGCLNLASLEPLSDEHFDILLRFAKVFDLTYTRFNDLKQAEAQAREAKIETALERVRARTMAMQKSDELNETNTLIIQQIKALEIPLYAFGIHICHIDEPISEAWMGDPVGGYMPKVIYDHSQDPLSVRMYSGWKEGNTLMVEKLEGEALKEHFEYMITLVPDRSIFDNLVAPDSLVFHFAYFTYGFFVFLTKEHCSQEHSIFKRLAKVFEQTYTRFLDLQKAEAQVREGQIEAALEKVRSRSLAMHKSDELQEVVNTVFERLQDLNIEMDSANIAIFKEGTRDYDYWIASPFQKRVASFHMPYLDLSLTRDITAARESGTDFSTTAYSFEEKNEWFDYAFNNTDFKFLTEERKQFILNAPGIMVAIAFSKHTGVQVNRYSSKLLTEGEAEILKRFSKVFEQAYIRFLDLQKAEAQANEARIEIALERIRARALAMHKSDELMEVAKVMREQMALLGQAELEASAVHLYEEDSDNILSWRAVTIGSDAKRELTFGHMAIPKNSCEFVREWLTKFYSDLKEYTIELSGSQQQEWYDVLFTLAPEVVNSMREKNSMHEKRYYRFSKFSGGALLMISKQEPSAEATYLQSRAAVVFDLAYRRFSDLQKAEAQARDAQIESSLERVRSKTMAMHNSQDVGDTVATMFDELVKLGIQTLRCGVGILHEGYQMELWTAKPNETGKIELFVGHMDMKLHPLLTGGYESWKDKRDSFSYELKDDDLIAYFNVINNYAGYQANYDIASLPSRMFHDEFGFNEGCLFSFSLDQLSAESSQIFKRFAGVFGQTYRRYLDLQKAEAQAREARIEAALERVRAKAMAMHSSRDLAETIGVFYRELKSLSVIPIRCGVALMDKETRFAELTTMNTTERGDSIEIIGKIKMAGHPVLDGVFENWLIQKEYHAVLRGNQIKEYYQVLKPQISYPDYSHDEVQFGYYFMFKEGDVYAWTETELSENDLAIYRRFTSVISLTYKRYKDLQQAEAQAKEAKIEASLERVRSKTMAMHNSEDVGDTVATMLDELVKLGVETVRCGIAIIDESKTMEVWTASSKEDGSVKLIIGKLDMSIHPLFLMVYDAWKNKVPVTTYELIGEDLKDYFRAINNSPDYPIRYDIESLPYRQSNTAFMFPEGSLFVFSQAPLVAETTQIFKRFAGVFGQTYRRYLDLLKAEAQAREAKIEASLERVRAKAMAMHKSDDLHGAVTIMFEEFQKLNLDVLRCGIGILNKHSRTGSVWTTSVSDNGLAVQISADESFDTHPLMMLIYEYWQKQEDLDYVLQGQDLIDYYRAMDASELKLPKSQLVFSDDELQPQYYYAAMFSAGGLYSFRDKPFTAEDKKIMKRFASVVNLTYNRFLDLQKAEAQAREAKIEASLERVRAKAMAMHKSEDLNSAVATVFDELDKLELGVLRCGISILDKEKRTGDIWVTTITDHGSAVQVSGDESFDIHPLLQGAFEAWLKKEDFSYLLEGDDLAQYYKAVKAANFQLPESQIITAETEFKKQYCHTTPYGAGGLFAFRETEFPTEAKTVMKRFAGVFDLTYKRFLDLQKAEANAREAQIEAGLERVRSRTMAMHSSDDVSVATATMFTELEKLGIENFRGGITNIKTNRTQDVWSVNNLAEGKVVKAVGTFNVDDHPFWQQMYKEWEAKNEFLHYYLANKEKEDYVRILTAVQGYLPQSIQQFPDVHFQVYFFAEGAVWTNSLKPHSEEDQQVMKRFTSVFSLTFRRYQDLKKAEARAREALIEAGLERVRARTMAMHSSDDVSTATATMFTELEKLGIESFRGGILNIRADQTMDVWSVNNLAEGKIVRAAGEFDMTMHPFWQQLYKGWVNRDEVLYFNMSGKDKEDYIRILDARRDYLPAGMQELPDSHIQSYYFGEGFVWTFTLQPHSEEDQQVMKKFASVFSLTFRRYQDLKKAEAQAREATIEAALEKVRGKAMAMHNSNDLTATASLVFTELRKLGISPMRCGVGMLNKENRKALLYSAIASEEGDSLSQIGWVLLDVNPVLRSIYDHWVSGEDYFPVLTKEMLKAYYEHLKLGFEVPSGQTEYEHYGYFLSFSEGVFYGWAEKPFTESEIKILKRFASVIDLTFRRYMELQKSEANAREAVKQAALDRVRAEIASMRTVGDLERITPLIWNELNILGIPFIRCGVFIMDEEQQLIHTFLSTPDGKAIAAFHIPYDTPGNIQYVLSNWHDKKRYTDHWDESAFTEFAKTLVKQGGLASPEQYLKTIPKGGFYLHFLPFLQGMLYVGNTIQLKQEEIELIQHVADAFSTAYARYEDFNKLEAAKQQVENTLTDLKQAQTQLVQAEKMASLGELTAGIAHEIQNPLNFVNNFSEVSKELLDEMKTELETGNTEDAKDIADDVIQNLEKINHHGKRADAIVKSMLQHSRSSTGKKEPTDINGLADEYLRLAYHGLRAKDKSFNAKFETDFDNSIGKINIISQDIGRVLVNLINNAFYAVSERKKQEANGYEPTVEVCTKKIDDKIEIKVKDNGNGIPQKVLDKIFQPFFTTKPTGQGTGLGLSLSYDIITKGHGGELKVETKEKEGTIFIVQLPL